MRGLLRVEITDGMAAFADDVIAGLSSGSWEKWQDEGDVPKDEPMPQLEVWHSRGIGWVAMDYDGQVSASWRIVCGPNGARAIVNAADDLADQRSAAKEDGPAALAHWRRMMRSAGALAKRMEPYAAPDR